MISDNDYLIEFQATHHIEDPEEEKRAFEEWIKKKRLISGGKRK